jgi:hypothetical protein
MAMLDKSNDGLPYSIVLLEHKPDKADAELIGHSRLCKVVHEPTAGFVESVVVRKNRRGMGLGRILMGDTEKHAVKIGLTKLYLCTYDKQSFYQHLGYKFCRPIVTFGSASGLLPEDQRVRVLQRQQALCICPWEIKPQSTRRVAAWWNRQPCHHHHHHLLLHHVFHHLHL